MFDVVLNLIDFGERQAKTGETNNEIVQSIKKKNDMSGTVDDPKCFYLTSFLAVLGQTVDIDLLSLNEEPERELEILQSIPWGFVHIKVIYYVFSQQKSMPNLTIQGGK